MNPWSTLKFRKGFFYLFVVCGVIGCTSACKKSTPSAPKNPVDTKYLTFKHPSTRTFTLTLRRMFSIQWKPSKREPWSRLDPSGLSIHPNGTTLWTVNDKARDVQVLELSVRGIGSGMSIAPRRIVQHSTRSWSLPSIPDWPRWKYRLDAEGLAACGQHWLIISEQLRSVIRVHRQTGLLTRHPIDVRTYERKAALKGHPLPRFSVDFNAGYEGIACSRDGRHLFVAQERSPRFIFIFKTPSTWRDNVPLVPVQHFDTMTFGLPQKIGRYVVPPDYSGLAIEGDMLYVLYRNARTLLKWNWRTSQLIASAYYGHLVKDLYRSNKPFGLAEGLALHSKSIWLILDNNGRSRMHKKADTRPLLLELKRPKGF